MAVAVSLSSPPPSGDTPPDRDRGSPIRRTGLFLTAVIAGCFAMGFAIYWLIRSGKY
jgi:hypothetical protein